MQMRPYLHSIRHGLAHRRCQRADIFRRRQANCIRQRNLLNPHIGHQIARRNYLVRRPRIAVWVPEGHRDIGHHAQSALVCRLANRLQRIQRLFRSLPLVPSQELRRNRIRKPQRRNRSLSIARSAPFLFTTIPIISTSSSASRNAEHPLRIRHLRHRSRRDKRHCIDMTESCGNQRAQIVRLHLRRKSLSAIPATHRAGTQSA